MVFWQMALGWEIPGIIAGNICTMHCGNAVECGKAAAAA